MSYLTELLHSSHRKAEFDCGQKLLNDYLHTQAKQEVKRRLSACFALAENSKVNGYYTLSGASIQRDLLPEAIIKNCRPPYLHLPATLLGRLAVENSLKGQGLGELILSDALKRSYNTSISRIGSMAIIVDPIDENAVKFYRKYGFIALPDVKPSSTQKSIG